MSIWVLLIGFLLASWLVSYRLKVKFRKYSKIPIGNGMSGKEIAEKMLRDNDVSGVKIGSVKGELTDHYNPANKTINLSKEVYFGTSVASAAIAAHETGHAIQHAKAYAWLGLRSKLVPSVSFVSKWVQWVLLAGVLLIQVFPALLLFGIGLFALTTIFSIITLPVEVDASKRALVWLADSGVTTSGTHEKAEDALRWAAYTYFIAALGSIATLLYYILAFVGIRD